MSMPSATAAAIPAKTVPQSAATDSQSCVVCAVASVSGSWFMLVISF